MVPMAGSGRVAESVSGGDGLLANPRSRPTPLSGVRTPPSEAVGWLLLLFAIEKQLKGKVFPAFFRKTQKSFGRKRCLQPLFSLYFWGQKYQKPPHVVLRGRIRPAALPGARKIGAYAPPRDCRAARRILFFRVERECGITVPPLAALFIL